MLNRILWRLFTKTCDEIMWDGFLQGYEQALIDHDWE